MTKAKQQKQQVKEKKPKKKLSLKGKGDITFQYPVANYILKIQDFKSKNKLHTGRPSKYDEVLELTLAYLQGGYEVVGNMIPSVAGLAVFCGVSRETLYKYKNENDQFSDILSQLTMIQEAELLSGGLSGRFNPQISKLVLGKHSYQDKIEQPITIPDIQPLADAITAGLKQEHGTEKIND